MLLGVFVVALAVISMDACAAASAPSDIAMPLGRWSGSGACLSVTSDGCDFVAGCGHGQFSRPTVHPDGSFTANGTYRIEVGPISITPAPPATFSGTLRGGTITLTVIPSDPSLKSFETALQLTDGSAKCAVPCV